MKHLNLKSFALGVGCAILVSSLAVTALAVSGAVTFSKINLEVNGTQVAKAGDNYTLDSGVQAPYSITYTDETGGGTTYLPVRKIGELLGAKIGWNAETGSVTVGETAPAKTPDTATADYSTWTAEEEKAYQEFKGMWKVEEIDDNYTKQAFAWYKNKNDAALAKQAIKSLDKETVYKQMTRFVCETSYVGIRFNAGDKDGSLFVVTREGVGYDWVYQNGKVMN